MSFKELLASLCAVWCPSVCLFPTLDCGILRMDNSIIISCTPIFNLRITELWTPSQVSSNHGILFLNCSPAWVCIFSILLFLTSKSLSAAGRCYTFQLSNSCDLINVLLAPTLFQVTDEEVKVDQTRLYLKFQVGILKNTPHSLSIHLHCFREFMMYTTGMYFGLWHLRG